MTRYTRQTRLHEVGEAGQARLAAATIALRTTGAAAQIERRYLVAAGAVHVVSSASGRSTPLPFSFESEAAREVACGAHAALAALRELWLGGTG